MHVINPATSNVIFDLFIRTISQECQPFPTHGTPLSPEQDTNSVAINLIVGYWPPTVPNYEGSVTRLALVFESGC